MTIKLSKNMKPETIVPKISHRYGITSAWYDAGAKAVRATDGRVAISIPVESNGEETGELPTDALKAFRKAAGRGQGELEITTTPDTVTCGGITMPRKKNKGWGTPMDMDAVIPKRLPDNTSDALVIGLDVKLLAKLATAMGVDIVRLQIGDPIGEPVRVDPNGSNTPPAVGAIMPVKVR